MIFWGLVAGGSTPNQITLGSSEEWIFWSQVFSKYKVIGMKIKYSPDRVVGGGEQREWKDVHVASFPSSIPYNANDFTPGLMKQNPDYFTTSFSKQLKKYVGVTKYEKRLNNRMYVPTDEAYSTAYTGIMGRDFNFSDGSELGMVQVTYYVHFKQPRVAIG